MDGWMDAVVMVVVVVDEICWVLGVSVISTLVEPVVGMLQSLGTLVWVERLSYIPTQPPTQPYFPTFGERVHVGG